MSLLRRLHFADSLGTSIYLNTNEHLTFQIGYLDHVMRFMAHCKAYGGASHFGRMAAAFINVCDAIVMAC